MTKEELQGLIDSGKVSLKEGVTIDELLKPKKKLKVLMLMGPRGGGKSTYACDLNSDLECATGISSFAEGVYGTVARLTRRTTGYIKDNKNELFKLSLFTDQEVTYRDLLVMIGDGGRLVNKDMWANSLCADMVRKVLNVLVHPDGDSYTIIIDDLRYPNEYLVVEKTVKELGEKYNLDTEIEVKYINHTHATEVDQEVPSEQMVSYFFKTGFTKKKFQQYINTHR